MAERIPGIIVRIVNDTSVINPPTFQRYPVIVGVGDPYRQIENTRVVRSLGVVDTIPAVSTINEIVTVGDLPGISKYTDGVDYSLAAGNTISWLPGGTKPATGNSFYVTYTETRAASAYQPTLYFDGNLVIADHGNITRTSGDINDVTKGALLALNNGSKGVMTLQLDPTSWANPDVPSLAELEQSFLDSVEYLESILGPKLFVVPMSSGVLDTTTAAAIMFNHAVLASQPERKQERTVIMANPANTTYQDYAVAAQAYSHERMVVTAIPTTLQMTGFSSTFDNRYYNAALAGRLCAGPIGETIHDEIIFGITFTDNFTPDVQTYLLQNGVSPARSSGGVVRNLMANTTDTTNALTEDLGVQDIKDYVKKVWREGLWDTFRNKPITLGLPNAIVSASENLLDLLISRSIVADYDAVTASQDPVEPRKINVTGRILPAVGLAWMDITFTFVLSQSAL